MIKLTYNYQTFERIYFLLVFYTCYAKKSYVRDKNIKIIDMILN